MGAPTIPAAASTEPAPAAASPQHAVNPAEPVDLVEDELLVEEISIDGMCGVY